MEHVGSSTAGALAVGVESGVRQRGRAITALIAAVVADGWHFHEVARAAASGGAELLWVSAPLAFLLSSLATYLWFGEQAGA